MRQRWLHLTAASSSSRKDLGDVPHVYTKERLKQGFSRTETQNQNLQIFQNMLYVERRATANLTVKNKPDGFEWNQAEESPNPVGGVGKVGVYCNN